MSQFTYLVRDGLQTWLHSDKPVWITRYDAVPGVRLECWHAYRSVKAPPKGRLPWTVDNKRIGSAEGFPSLESAIEAVEAWLTAIAKATEA
jgi:hypothetical protein